MPALLNPLQYVSCPLMALSGHFGEEGIFCHIDFTPHASSNELDCGSRKLIEQSFPAKYALNIIVAATLPLFESMLQQRRPSIETIPGSSLETLLAFPPFPDTRRDIRASGLFRRQRKVLLQDLVGGNPQHIYSAHLGACATVAGGRLEAVVVDASYHRQ